MFQLFTLHNGRSNSLLPQSSGYPGLVLRHLEREQGCQKKGPNAHPIDGVGPYKFQKSGWINQGKAPSKGCACKLAPQRHLVLDDYRGLMSAPERGILDKVILQK